MAPKVRDRIINALIYVASGICVAMVMYFVNNKDADAQELERKIDSKLDKIEFTEYEKQHKIEHVDQENRIIQHFDSRFDDFKDFMIELNKN
jgi:hypothetical protein